MFIIGIAGGTASGKSTIASAICQSQPALGLISQDSYYKKTDHLNPDDRKCINFDHPDAIDFDLLINQVETLKAGHKIAQPIYSFLTHNRTADVREITPKKILIVEGILIFSNPKLRELFDLKIYVDCPDDLRLMRRLARDTTERGRSSEQVLKQYIETLKPMHEAHIEPTKSLADVVIQNTKSNKAAVTMLHHMITQLVSK